MGTFLNSNTQLTDIFDQENGLTNSLVDAAGPPTPNLQSQVNVLTNSIGDEAVRLAVGKVLTDLVFLLDYLSLVAGSRNIGGIKEVVSILDTVRSEAYALSVFIENNALRLEGVGDRLRETLDSCAYAINHEVRRIFESDLAHLKLDWNNQETQGALLHAQGVLTNCFQQCMINLARVFDASLSDATLFQDWQSRRESSLVLYHDLSELSTLIQASAADSLNCFPEQPHDFLEERLTSFRNGSMQCLMYKDWQQFEALTDAILGAITRGESPTDQFHRMGCYLETLLAHVKARSVLADLTLEPTLHS